MEDIVLLGILLAPALGALGILLLSGEDDDGARRLACTTSFVSLALAVGAACGAWSGGGAAYLRTLEVGPVVWVPSIGVTFHLALDGISLVMALLTSLVLFTACLVSYRVRKRPKEFLLALLVTGCAAFGMVLSRDLFWFFLAYQLAAVPMFLLLGGWGSGDRERTPLTTALVLTGGAWLALAGVLVVYFEVGPHLQGGYTFDLPVLLAHLEAHPDVLPAELQSLLFPLMLLGFGSLALLWPLHVWSPRAQAAAPPPAAMMLGGALVGLGAFGLLSVAIPLCPAGAREWSPVLAALACVGILWSGMVAMVRRDLRGLLGYSSCSVMGYVMLGMAALDATALTGVVILLFAHGVGVALAFASVGWVHEQTGTDSLEDLGGLSTQLPFIGGSFGVATMAAVGLPGLATFPGLLLVLLGLWSSRGAGGEDFPYRVHTILALWGLVAGAVGPLRALRLAFLGPRSPRWDGLEDARGFSRTPFVVLVAVLIVIGCYPPLLVGPASEGVAGVLARLF